MLSITFLLLPPFSGNDVWLLFGNWISLTFMNSHKVVEKAICVEEFSTSLNSVLWWGGGGQVKLIFCCIFFFVGPLSFS